MVNPNAIPQGWSVQQAPAQQPTMPQQAPVAVQPQPWPGRPAPQRPAPIHVNPDPNKVQAAGDAHGRAVNENTKAVSYTHLTLPTNREV